VLRAILAGVAGYCLIAVLVMAGTAATTAAFGATPDAVPSSRDMLINILLGMLAAAAGGYVCARLAPAGRVTIAVGLLFAVFLIAGVIAGRAAATPTQPRWFHAVVTLLGASALLIGVVIERAQEAGRARRAAG
jgi:hypothetical protein